MQDGRWYSLKSHSICGVLHTMSVPEDDQKSRMGNETFKSTATHYSYGQGSDAVEEELAQ